MSKSRKESVAEHKAVRRSLDDDASKTRGVPNGRDTKRFCHGKVGVEHTVAVGTYRALKNWQFAGFERALIRYCTTCGKELAHYIPPSWARGRSWPARKPHVVPDWAEAYYAEHSGLRPAFLAELQQARP